MELYFKLGGDVTIVKIMGHNLMFATSQSQFQFSSIEGLKLSTGGILKEFPDLEGESSGEIRKEGIKRLKEKLKNLKNDSEIKEYVIEELGKYGYKLVMEKKEGFRPKKVK